MSIEKQLKSVATLLLKKKQLKDSAILDAEVLLSFTLNKSKEFLYGHPEFELTITQQKKFKQLIKRRLKFEPVAYLTGHKEFYGLDFIVNKNVLIPRPETELIIDEVLKIQRYKDIKIQSIADVGTGSGCIAIALKKLLPTAKIYAADISAKALAVAKKNAHCHNVKINFLKGDLLAPLKNKKIDIIVANLPYLDKNYKNLLNSSATVSLKFEPKLALDGGRFGLAVYEKFFKQLGQLKNKPKIVICEIGHAYSNPLKKLLNKYLPNSKFEIKKDLANFQRILLIKLN